MVDKEEIDTRIKILKTLQDFNKDDPYNFLPKEKLLEILGQDFDEKSVDRNIKYLRDKGYIKLHLFLGGSFMAQITADGIDYLEFIEDKNEGDL